MCAQYLARYFATYVNRFRKADPNLKFHLNSIAHACRATNAHLNVFTETFSNAGMDRAQILSWHIALPHQESTWPYLGYPAISTSDMRGVLMAQIRLRNYRQLQQQRETRAGNLFAAG